MTALWKPSDRTSGRFRDVRIVDETGSTNADLAAEAKAGAPPGAVLIARHQTAGRGRQGRSWFDRPDSSLLMSWTVDAEPASAPLLSLVAGTAMCTALERLAGRPIAALKWPNDVLVPDFGHRKLVGILSEVVALPRRSERLRVIVGMGTNLDLDLAGAPADVAERAVDLTTVLGGPIDRAALVDALLDACDEGVSRLEASPADALAEYRARCLTIGQSVRFETSNGAIFGVAEGVGDDGALHLRDAEGIVHRLTAGDAHHG